MAKRWMNGGHGSQRHYEQLFALFVVYFVLITNLALPTCVAAFSFVHTTSFPVHTTISLLRQSPRSPYRFYQSSSSSNDKPTTTTSTQTSIIERLNLANEFERWRLLQTLLDGEAKAIDVNQILYAVLASWHTKLSQKRQNKNKKPKVPERREVDDTSADPAVDADDFAILTHLVMTKSTTTLIPSLFDTIKEEEEVLEVKVLPALTDPACQAGPDPSIISDLTTLLPNADEDPDAYKGNWDTILEIHGRESVKVNEEQRLKGLPGGDDWDARCSVARVLVYFNFLLDGILEVES